MANTTVSINSNGTEYRFGFDGQSGISPALIVSMILGTIILSLVIAVAGFAIGNVAQGFLGLAILGFSLLAPILATTKTVTNK